MRDPIWVYDTHTGRKLPHPVPARWLDHPRRAARFKETPRSRAGRFGRLSATPHHTDPRLPGTSKE